MATKRRIFDLAGESATNRDGSSRQEALHKSNPGDLVQLVREPENPYDPNAILVVSDRLEVGLGYLSRDDAVLLAPSIDKGFEMKGQIHELTGGLEDYPSFGCRVCIVPAIKSFNPVRNLTPEQVHYQHAPVWRRKPSEASQRVDPKRRKRSGGDMLAKLLKGLFK